MFVITRSPRLWLISSAVSLILFLIVYFTVIRPDNNAANQALKSGLQQSQQVINQAQKQLKTSGASGSAVGSQAQQTLSKAAKLTACVQAAGTDTTKLASCQSKYGG
jgi:flagellar biosynthesis/type III secretory pathway M-ring protein FliF/YscJ